MRGWLRRGLLIDGVPTLAYALSQRSAARMTIKLGGRGRASRAGSSRCCLSRRGDGVRLRLRDTGRHL